MKPNFLIKVTILVVMMIFLVSCSGSSGAKQIQYNFKQGVAELNYKFFPNAPPEKIYPKSNFKMILELDNQEAYDITNGKVKIVGLDERFFRVDPLKKDFQTLLGRSLTNPSGDKDFIEFDGEAFELFENSEEYSANYFLKISYNSKMEFTDSLCLNPKLYEIYDSGCKMEERKSYSGQGAPLVVSEIEPIIYPAGAGAQLELRARLDNLGRGKINDIQFESAKLGNQKFDTCAFQDASKEDVAILYKDKQETILICRVFLPDQKSYTTTLTMSFSYDYEVEEQHQLLMVK